MGFIGKYGGYQRAFVLLAALTVGLRCGSTARDPSPASEGGGAGVATTGGAANSGGKQGSGGTPLGMGGAASGGKASANDWQPDFPLGEPGWKDSREPFCDVNQGRVAGGGVFADSRGVFALVNNECVPRGRDLPNCSPEGQLAAGVSLSFNDGHGWRPLLDAGAYGVYDLTGFPDGPLLLGQRECSAALFDLDEQSPRCALTGDSDWLARRSFVANDSLAYVLDAGALFEYRDGIWTTLAKDLPEAIQALWADDEIVYLAGEYQLYSLAPRGDAELRALPDAPAARYTAVWGFASDDVWFGNSVGQLVHYDGRSFRQGPIPVERNADEHPQITQLWGSDGELFFSSFFEFGRVTQATAARETLVRVETLGFWGTSPRDIFIAVSDDEFTETACGAAFFLYFDGHEFHRF